MKYNLKIILASTRPGRKGPAVANWIYQLARKREAFETTLVDLAEINLPFLDEPKLPRYKDYSKEHTKQWSQIIDTADAFIFVTPEYNNGYPASLKNALDFLYREWAYKPVAFVSYGGVAGGTRSVQQLKQVILYLKMIPISQSLSFSFFTRQIDDEGRFIPGEGIEDSAGSMLDELNSFTGLMSRFRQSLNP